ncbi:hypothetical protein AB0O34_36120 [Sphaerisporangium sp. NPDC088356]|uniref:hypothetical protein n=1 Tax=Sphaerisporangium sp. NPDC088356 TaxID=3154871 RepID=UPI0034328882
MLAALDDPDPSVALQPYAERVRREAGLDFITIMSREGRRYTHPNTLQIGGRFLGNTAPALAGHTFTETYTGTPGPSVRAVTPVRDAAEAVRGVPVVGGRVRGGQRPGRGGPRAVRPQGHHQRPPAQGDDGADPGGRGGRAAQGPRRGVGAGGRLGDRRVPGDGPALPGASRRHRERAPRAAVRRARASRTALPDRLSRVA